MATAPGLIAHPGAADLQAEFPIKSETTDADRLVLLGVRGLLRARPSYSYAEVGSFLGGSLVPFLRDPHCDRVLSIDERGRLLPDERGRSFDYSHITEAMMVEGLAKHCADLRKLETFDGSISAYRGGEGGFDVLFIDGEHTDRACFRDFVHGRKLLKPDAIVLFHDSTLIHKALLLIQELLAASGERYRFHKARGSEMSILLLNDLCSLDVGAVIPVDADMAAFHRESEVQLLTVNVRNRFGVRWLLREAAYRAYVRLPPSLRVAGALRRFFTGR